MESDTDETYMETDETYAGRKPDDTPQAHPDSHLPPRSGLLLSIETGIIAIDRLRLMHRARNGSKSARIIEVPAPERPPARPTLVGTNITSTVIATLAASVSQAY